MDPAQVLAAKKARMQSSLIFSTVCFITLAAAVGLAFDIRFADIFGAEEDPANEFSWEAEALKLPDILADRVPAIFTPGAAGVESPLQTTRPPTAEEIAAERAKKAKIEALVKEGEAQLKRRQFQEAERTLLEVVKLDESMKTDLGMKFYDQGRRYERQRAWSRAELLYRMSLHFDYESSKFHAALAKAYRVLGKGNKASEHERLSEKFKEDG